MSFSPINKLLVTGSADRHVRLWDPRVAGTLIHVLMYND